MIKGICTVFYYRLRQWTVQSPIVDCIVYSNRLYSPLPESVLGGWKKKLNVTEENA